MGAFGLQFGFALPQANATRIFQNLGASLDSVPLLWLAGPITGLIVQPLVGYYSDRTWTRFGRRRPYFLAGAALAAAAMIAMPNATTLWTAMFMLWLLDASVNFTMGPYRAFVADQMSAEQRSTGYLMYMFFASIGAVVGSLLPWAMAHLGFRVARAGGSDQRVRQDCVLRRRRRCWCAALCWSAFMNREYPPEVLRRLSRHDAPDRAADRSIASACAGHAFAWIAAGSHGLADRRGNWARGSRSTCWSSPRSRTACRCSRPVRSARAMPSRASSTTSRPCRPRCAGSRWCSSSRGSRCSRSSSIPRPPWRSCISAPRPRASPAYEAGANWVGVLFATYNGLGAVDGSDPAVFREAPSACAARTR